MMHRTTGMIRGALIASGAIGMVWSCQAKAQDTNTEGSSERRLDTVMVTSQKREQNILDVPISITALSGNEIRDTGLSDVAELQTLAPGLQFSTSTSEALGTQIRIRGVGTVGQNTGLEGSVGVFLDGIYIPKSGMAMMDLIDIERVEVLRGPQGTLFGKNTSAGALSITTRKPEFDFGGMSDFTVGNFGLFKARASVTGPLIRDVLAVRLSGGYHQRDGLIDDVESGSGAVRDSVHNTRDRYSVRAQALFTPTPGFEGRFIASYEEKDETCCEAPFAVNGPRSALISALGGTVLPDDEFARKVAVNGEHNSQVEDFGLSADLRWELGFADLVSLTGYRDYSADVTADVDRTDLDIANSFGSFSDEFFSQELRLQGNAGRVDWLIGAYYFDEDQSSDGSNLFGEDAESFILQLVPPVYAGLVTGRYGAGRGALANDFSQKSTGWSLFTHNEIGLTDKLSVIAGLRWNNEDKSGSGRFVTDTPACANPIGLAVNFYCPVPDFDADYNDDKLTGTFTVQYQLTESMNAYAGYSRGYKAGGINLDRSAGTSGGGFEFLPETVDSYEAGLKADLMDGRLRTTASVYSGAFENYQLNTFTGNGFYISNAAGVESRGAEVEATARPIDRLFIRASAAFNETQYTDETEDPNLAGHRISGAPKWVLNGGFGYEAPIAGNIDAFFRADAVYRSGQNTGSDLDLEKYQDAYTLVNLNAGVRNDADGWRIAVWAKNLFDEDYIQVAFDTPAQPGSINAFLGNPATYGVTFSKDF